MPDRLDEKFDLGYRAGVTDALDELEKLASQLGTSARMLRSALPTPSADIQLELVRDYYARQADMLVSIEFLKVRLLYEEVGSTNARD
jgi:hypothetical protein